MPSLLELLLRDHPGIPAMVEKLIEHHVPSVNGDVTPVTVPRYLWDALCLLALVGVEAVALHKGEIKES